MSYSTELLILLTSFSGIESEIQARIHAIVEERIGRLEDIALKFALGEVSPASTFELETAIAEELRELARELVEMLYNTIEPEDPEVMPHDVTDRKSTRLNSSHYS